MKYLLAFLSAAILSVAIVPFANAAETAATPSPTQVTAASKQVMININTADATALIQLKGIGAKKAEAIVAWRKANGKFTSPEQLLEVKGIGAAILEANRAKIQI
jgi:competence protein ComEA